jgi:hypothetical protein
MRSQVLGVTLFVLFWAVGVFLLAFSVSGCSLGSSLIVSAVEHYCGLPTADRAAYRALINERSAPNYVRIDCTWGIDD